MIMREKGLAKQVQGLARLGGDEFTLFVEDIGHEDNAIAIACRCLESIGQAIEYQDQLIRLSASIGIALYPRDGDGVDTLLKNAEQAMYIAKQKGGNCFKFYHHEMNAEAVSSFRLENDLRNAIENDELTLHYQPQVDSRTGEALGMEVLCRWEHPKLGMIPPDQFIPICRIDRIDSAYWRLGVKNGVSPS